MISNSESLLTVFLIFASLKDLKAPLVNWVMKETETVHSFDAGNGSIIPWQWQNIHDETDVCFKKKERMQTPTGIISVAEFRLKSEKNAAFFCVPWLQSVANFTE